MTTKSALVFSLTIVLCLAGPAPVSYLSIASINLNEAVYPVGRVGTPGNDTYRVLANNVGWHNETTPPCGDESNTVLNGHNPGVFEKLPQVKIGDELVLCGVTYKVSEVVIVREDVSEEERRRNAAYIWPTPDRRITLITCVGKSRLIVIARPEED